AQTQTHHDDAPHTTSYKPLAVPVFRPVFLVSSLYWENFDFESYRDLSSQIDAAESLFAAYIENCQRYSRMI
uniref:hypothetical protein n=1 Tax=Rothia dentocariosa TaxID=2047 RepID=UPI00244C194B